MLTLLKTGPGDRASASVPGVEIDEREKKIQMAIQEWAWQVHEAALHDAGQKEGPLKVGNSEMLLKRVSDEVTHKADEERKKSVAMAKRS